ncbi:MAG: alpha/beta hydrolase, partial [Gammaproteobacteria bacterium]|nr:alpha/beta hydrolase [Gammaproteobacteria bacterium]
MHTTQFTTNGNIHTAFHDTGSGDTTADQTFVLVHGFTGSKLDFHDQLDWFATKHRVIAYDQRGHGESSNIGPYNLYSLTADLIGFLDAMEVNCCHILGHSLGGMVVIRALLAHPHRFRSAILMDTAPFAPKLFSAKARQALNNMVTDNGCTGLLDGMLG